MTDSPDHDRRHAARMARKKAVMEARIARASAERGVLVVNTGNGKGKTSAALGMAVRALGHGMRVGLVQFVKGSGDTGELAFLARVPGIDCHVMGDGFTWDTQDRQRDMATARAAWSVARGMLRDPGLGLVVLDELNIVLKYGYLPLDEVLADLESRPRMQHVVVTGRAARDELIAIADTVTEMHEVRHAFRNGVRAQKGVEY